MINRYLRAFLWLISPIQLLFAVGFFLQMPFVTRLWPLPYTNNLSFIFLSSILAAAAASTLWCLYTREDGALAGVALDYVAIFIPVAVFAFQVLTRTSAGQMFAIAASISAVFGIWLFMQTQHIPFKNPLPLPRPLRYAFIIFLIALILAGGALVLKTPNILPWSVSTEASVMYGWFFIGAAAYFAYGLLRPAWANAGGQVAGFLAYDLVLLVPFLLNFATVRPSLRLNLIIYLIVITTSAALSIYYLFINPETRLWQRRLRVSTNPA